MTNQRPGRPLARDLTLLLLGALLTLGLLGAALGAGCCVPGIGVL